jgi:hypothetical protein
MNFNANMISTQNLDTTDNIIKNKGFSLLDCIFKENGWHMTKNEMNWISYTKRGFETEYFEITITPSKINVSIPIRNCAFQYNTSFKDYYMASEYIEDRFKDFISYDKV